jgi:hypothetical protein
MLLHHYPRRRLDAESIRDAMLAVSGRLDRALYGPSIDPKRAEAKDYRRLFDGPLDGAGRRSVYTKITRMEGPAFLEVFDFPAPLAARGARDSTNVPAQALALLNDPFVLDQAAIWADRMIAAHPADGNERLHAMIRCALGRRAAPEEIERFAGLADRMGRLHGAGGAGLLASRPVWRDVAHAIFNLKEFIYVP